MSWTNRALACILRIRRDSSACSNTFATRATPLWWWNTTKTSCRRPITWWTWDRKRGLLWGGDVQRSKTDCLRWVKTTRHQRHTATVSNPFLCQLPVARLAMR